MLESFSNCIKSERKWLSDIYDKLQDIRLKKNHMCSAHLIRFASLLRYTLLMKEFKFPSLSILHKISKGKINAFHKSGSSSNDVMTVFDEIYTQKSD